MTRYINPIIPGFYPDPSVCRVGNDYYLVTSSFAYFPGVPIFHSRDLIHWRQIGHCLTRDSQLPLAGAGSSAGIYAPTIRYHNGLFYMVTTNVSGGGHFYVVAQDPAAEWSDPIWLGQDGIDPSLFFDEDGRAYFTWTTDNTIYQAELDVQTGQLLTEKRPLWNGTGGRYPEAPHIYNINGTYYLMIAEGGTEYGHMETIARSASVWGPFEPCPRNPIFTNRDLNAPPIQGTGHGDLVQAHDGSWWMVLLAFRCPPRFYGYHQLGRETFLAPVTWDENGWPVVYRNGTIDVEMEADCLPAYVWEADPTRDDFDSPTLNFRWNFLRNPLPTTWSLSERPGWLRLRGTTATLSNRDSLAFVGRRQQHMTCRVRAALDFSPQNDEEAGLTVFMNETHHYEIGVRHDGTDRWVFVRRQIGDLIAEVASEIIPAGVVELQIEADEENYHFAYAVEGQPTRILASGAVRYLSSEVAGGFLGVYFGMYATGKSATSPADFDWFEYQSL